jgi:hypothetical protein
MMLTLPNALDGALSVGSSQTKLTPRMQEEAFLATPEGQCSARTVATPSYATYKVDGEFEVENLYVGIVVRFAHGELASVVLSVARRGANWDAWTEAEELRNRDDLERILTAIYGTRRTFSWGGVGTAYDPRSGCASLTVGFI